MFMSDTEITGSFKRADNKTEQLKILAELNATSKDTIRDVLRKNGVPEEDIPKDSPKKKAGRPKVSNSGANVKISSKVYTEKKKNEVLRISEEQLEKVKEAMKTEKPVIMPVTSDIPTIPEVVRKVCEDRVAILTEFIMELERERDSLCDFLDGVGANV